MFPSLEMIAYLESCPATFPPPADPKTLPDGYIYTEHFWNRAPAAFQQKYGEVWIDFILNGEVVEVRFATQAEYENNHPPEFFWT